MSNRRGARNVRQRTGVPAQAAAEPPVLMAETFEVRDPERDMYTSLNARTVVKPSVVKWSEWLEMRDNNDPYAAYFVDHIRALGLESIAMVNEPISKQLLLEFYLTFTWTEPNSFSIRLNGHERQVTAELCEQIFGFRCQRYHSDPRDEDYNEGVFWDSIRTDADWNENIRFALTYVELNNLYMVYRFFARCVLNKDEPSRMNHKELYLLWCMLNKPAKAEVFPHIWDVILSRIFLKPILLSVNQKLNIPLLKRIRVEL
ncbi:hypothetical protein CASFOL_029319 [Castilleja foliolosa]|uniref:Uncharacterized protein n=1 Tax=Castilleja foliolosa TaxID=1961234 RepID=A0ABD3CAH1_9LAMI